MKLILFAVVSALSRFGGGKGEIFIDNAHCVGTERRPEDCPHNGVRNHNCALDHHEDAGVICHSGLSMCIDSLHMACCFSGRS